jgi:hypothetical protein
MRAGRFAKGAVSMVACAVATSGVAAADDAALVVPPPLSLTVSPGTGGGPWTLRVENTGEVPVRIVADPRLLALELTRAPEAEPSVAPRASKKTAKTKPAPTTLRCALPADARPTSDDGPGLVVPAKRSWSTTFDPLFFCFGARERKALLPGVTVTPTLGWPLPAVRAGKEPAAPRPPFLVTPVGAAVGKLAPAKQIQGAPFMLAEAVTVEPATAATPAPSADASPDGDAPSPDHTQPATKAPLVLSVPEAIDVARATDATATVTAENRTDRAVPILFRPSTLQLRVTGPSGSVTCGSRAEVESPIRELFVTIAPRRRAQVTMLLASACPAGTFDEPGVYRIVPRLDTTAASGRPLGLKTWDGEIEGSRPLLVRVRRGKPPAEPSRPSLD